ncbi:MAG: YDG domain-containing protein, partial [Clostridiales bacterium]|nr:YDG domain-containing protein [Clostridiales bacterium]
SPVIAGNTITNTSTEQNVYLLSGKYITLDGTLTTSASVGVTSHTSLGPGESVQITTETGSYNYYLDALAYFYSDSSDCRVQTNGDGYLELYSALIPGSVTITGDAVYGQELTAELSTNVPENVTYQWMRDGAAITGATASAYTLTAEDIGKNVSVQVAHADYIDSLTASSDTVQKATLVPSISGATSKAYDGTVDVTAAQGLSIILSGIVDGDTVIASASFAYDSESVGDNKTITADGISLSGSEAGNYILSVETLTTNGTITVAEQSISYSEDYVTKHMNGTAFINDLTMTTVDGGITYASDDPTVATVDENTGKVTIVGAGTATITATAAASDNYNRATASYTLVVTDHSYTATVVAPTYTEQGYTLHTCMYCDDSYKTDYTAIRVIDGTDGNLSTKTTIQELTAVPDGLKNLYSSVDELIADMISRVTVGTAYTADNAFVYDVVLQYSTDGGITWITATAENFPATGITVTIPYPEGTDSSYEFVVEHMFTVTSERLGITAGETERPTVTKTDDGLVVTLTGLSPVAVSWKAVKTTTAETETTDTSTTSTVSSQTGDNSPVALWLALLSVSGAGVAGAAAYNRKRKYNR